ncbi:alginate lyase family protein [Comamonas sp. GB3 AK4-5]|uniref:alginate lyase family protein n=1 Tax=Comamonas sp. GB3 AK4-5 TaxID=3231487 RepID=UPI00351E657E
MALATGLLGGVGAVSVHAQSCEAAPPGQPDIRAIGYYIDKAYSVIDPELKRESQQAVAGLNGFAAKVARWSDDYLRSGERLPAACTLQWLAAWARDGAMQGRMIRVNNDQPYYMRQWMLDAVALAYLKVHDQADAAQRAVIEPWLQQLAVANLAYWDDAKHRRNNHYYWGGLGVLATGLVTGNDALWRAGHEAFRSGVQAIQPDGRLPFEMTRGRRALHYHDYALAPLVLMAELARLRGEDWYGDNHHAIDRLARRVAEGWSDASWFAEQAGVPQEVGKPGRSSGWVEFYRLRTPEPAIFEGMHAYAPFHDPTLGGDLTLMATKGIVRSLAK